MAKEFYTERDIEDLFKRGVRSLEVGDDVVLTELAYERAGRLGMQLIQGSAAAPPSAPIRPPTAQAVQSGVPCPCEQTKPAAAGADLQARIRNAVNAKLGGSIDPQLLDVIIRRVLKATGAK